jgi:hypothetical protein
VGKKNRKNAEKTQGKNRKKTRPRPENKQETHMT